MAVNIKSILFSHLLHDASNQLAQGIAVEVQFYNVATQSWLALTGPISLTNGNLNHTLKIPSRISTKNQTIRVVREILKSGGTPSFRIIRSNASPIVLSIARIPEVIATTFNATVEGESKLTIDFNTSWLLEPDKRINKENHILIASHVSMFEFTQAIGVMRLEKENTLSQITGLNDTIASLSTERESLRTQLDEQKRRIESLETIRVGDTNFEILYNDLQQQVSTITKDKENLERDILQITRDKETLEQNFSVVNADKENLEREVNDLRVMAGNFEQERISFTTSISQLQGSLQTEKELVKTRETELKDKQALFTKLQKENLRLKDDLSAAQDYTATAHPNKLSANKVYSSIVRDVIKADEELVNAKYKLSNISLNLKTTVEKGPEGTVFGLLDFESAKEVNTAAISDIRLDIVPSGTQTIQTAQTMPNVMGLTESAVRKVLQNYGLRLDAIYHATKDESIIAGQSFKQSPEQGSEIEEGQEVIVIFSKPIN